MAATCCGCSVWMGPGHFHAHIAPAKAHTAALGRRESKVYEDVIKRRPHSFLSVPAVAGMLEAVCVS